jgi:hypothetical protein
MNQRFGGNSHLHLQGRKSAEQETNVCLATCYHVGFVQGRFSSLYMEVMRSSETSVHIRATYGYIPEDQVQGYELTGYTQQDANNQL